MVRDLRVLTIWCEGVWMRGTLLDNVLDRVRERANMICWTVLNNGWLWVKVTTEAAAQRAFKRIDNQRVLGGWYLLKAQLTEDRDWHGAPGVVPQGGFGDDPIICPSEMMTTYPMHPRWAGVYMQMCRHIHTRVRMYMGDAHAHAHTHNHMHTCTRTSTQIHTNTHMHTDIHTRLSHVLEMILCCWKSFRVVWWWWWWWWGVGR